MIIRPNLSCSYWWEFVYTRIMTSFCTSQQLGQRRNVILLVRSSNLNAELCLKAHTPSSSSVKFFKVNSSGLGVYRNLFASTSRRKSEKSLHMHGTDAYRFLIKKKLRSLTTSKFQSRSRKIPPCLPRWMKWFLHFQNNPQYWSRHWVHHHLNRMTQVWWDRQARIGHLGSLIDSATDLCGRHCSP